MTWNKIGSLTTPGVIALAAPLVAWYLKKNDNKKKCDCKAKPEATKHDYSGLVELIKEVKK